MRLILLILHLVLAYILLSGWPESFAVWLRAGLALIVVMLAVPLSGVANHESGRVKLRSLRVPKWIDYLVIGTVFFGLELLLLAMFTLGPETAEEAHAEVKYWMTEDRAIDGRERAAPDQLSHAGAGNWLWDNHFSRSHPTQAAKRPPSKPEIFMEVKDSVSQLKLRKHSIYLKTFALDAFDGLTWSINRPSRLVMERPSLISGAEIPLAPIIEKNRAQLPLYEHTITQPHYSDGQNILTTLHHVLKVDIDSLTKVNTDTYTLRSLPVINAESGREASSYSYAATSQPLLLNAITEFDNELKVGSPGYVYLSKVNVPSLQAKITEFVAGIDRSLPLAEQLAAIDKLINDQCTYSLTIQNNDKINPLENFLFEEKTGYCEFYASATAVMCRELGIPSRIAFGWSGGKFYDSSDLFVFRSKDAHAWAEVYLEGYGWVVFDTTPPSENEVTESKEDEAPPEISEMSADYDGDFESEDDGRLISWMSIIYTFIGFVILLIGLLLTRRFTQPKQHSITSTYVKEEPKYLQIFQKLSTKLGQPFKPGSTLMQNVEALQKRELDISGLDELLEEILTYHYDTTYRNTLADKSKENHFSSALKKIIKQVES